MPQLKNDHLSSLFSLSELYEKDNVEEEDREKWERESGNHQSVK